MIGHPLKVRELLDEIERGDVLLPEIQRAYVWKGPQVAKLLVSCPSDSLTKSSDLFEDRVGRGGPGEWVTAVVVVVDEVLDLADELANALERAPTNGALGDDVEPDLHLVEPRGVGRGVMHMEARSRRQPTSHLGVLVGAVVVDDEMNLEILRDRRFDVA